MRLPTAAYGTFATSQEGGSTSAFGGNSDIEQTPSNDQVWTPSGLWEHS
jgi:hypothetical protein